MLTVEQGIEVQKEQLSRWETVLKPEVYSQLVAWATKYNHLAIDGYEITRGTEFDNFLGNLMLGHEPEKITQTIEFYHKTKI